MVGSDPLGETVRLTAVFFAIVVALALAGEFLGVGAFGGPSIVATGVVPLVLYLLVTGRIERVGAAGFELAVREQARRPLSVPPDRRVEPYHLEKIVAKGAAHRLDELRQTPVEDLPTTLAFELETMAGNYQPGLVREYLDVLSATPAFRYVLFTDHDDRFEGYVDAETFAGLLSRDDDFAGDVVREIEDGTILERPFVVTDAIPTFFSIGDALGALERHDGSELAVVDSEQAFLGVVTQDALVEGILTEVIREADSGPVERSA